MQRDSQSEKHSEKIRSNAADFSVRLVTRSATYYYKRNIFQKLPKFADFQAHFTDFSLKNQTGHWEKHIPNARFIIIRRSP